MVICHIAAEHKQREIYVGVSVDGASPMCPAKKSISRQRKEVILNSIYYSIQRR